MTIKQIQEIERRNKAGENDREIAQAMGLGCQTVRYWRWKSGLPPRGKAGGKPKTYIIYDGRTTQFIMEGSAEECAKRMGITIESFYTYKMRFDKGKYKKYEIYTEEDLNED